MNFFQAAYVLLSYSIGIAISYFSGWLKGSLGERKNALPPPHLPPRQWIWIQAVSLGELLLVEPLVKKILEKKVHIHITTSTNAGFNLLKTLLSTTLKDDHISGGFFPLDLVPSLKFWMKAQPKSVILMETELWPNLIRLCKKNQIPIGIVNGRLTRKSLRWIKRLTMSSLAQLDFVIARDHESDVLFRGLGAPVVHFGGNLKAACIHPDPLTYPWHDLSRLWNSCPIWVIGNTLDGEEALLLNLWKQRKKIQPNLKCILAPRQPKRFDKVEVLLRSENHAYTRASHWKRNTQILLNDILLLDTVGDLSTLYQLGELAFIGGGWMGRGGHNPLESLRYGVQTIIGSHYENFIDLVPPLLSTGYLAAVSAEQLYDYAYNFQSPVGKELDPSLRTVLSDFEKALDRTWEPLQRYV